MNTIFNFSCHNGAKTQSITFFVSFLFSFLFSFSQVKDTTSVNKLDEVLVSAIRVTTKTPVSFSNLDKEDIKFRNLGKIFLF
jgi:iron complex outermembrane receptor protein